MKILKLRFMNLNSLYGEWVIDFTDPAFTNSGIFAITGPTGAGKSTILDALCLGLYGETPRLGRLSKSSNELMSRRTGECFSEVEFETARGRFRCFWSQHRARKKPGANLAESSHEISDAITGKIIESKKRDTLAAVEERTGMDFKRFSRSLMLAQGSFDAFLRSPPDERAPLLEQITGTEIYSRISRETHRIKTEAEGALKLLEAEISGVTLLTEEEVKCLEEEQKSLEVREKELVLLRDELNRRIHWLEGMAALEEEMAALEAERTKLTAAEEAYRADKIRLDQAVKGAALEGDYRALEGMMKRFAQGEEERRRGEEELPSMGRALAELRDKADQWEKQWEREKPHRDSLMKSLDRAAELDTLLRGLEEKAGELNRELAGLRKTCAAYGADRDLLSARTEEVEFRLQELTARREPSEGDRILREHREKIASLIDLREHVKAEGDNMEREVEKRRKRLGLLRRRKEELDRDLAGKREARLGAEERMGALDKERETLLAGRNPGDIRREKEGLLRESALISRIQSLEAERQRLREGVPCPLCGSREHPFSKEETPLPDRAEGEIARLDKLLARLEEREGDRESLREEINRLGEASGLLEGERTGILREEENLVGELAAREEERVRSVKKREAMDGELLEWLRPLGFNGLPPDLGEFKEEMIARAESLDREEKERLGLKEEMEGTRHEIKRLHSLWESHSGMVREKETALGTLSKKREEQLRLRREIWPGEDPLGEKEKLRHSEKDHQDRMNRLSLDRETLASRLEEREKRQADLKETQEEARAEWERAQADFEGRLGEAGFGTKEAFLESLLPPEERERLAGRGEELKERRLDWEARRSDRKARLEAERARKLTASSREELEGERDKVQEELTEKSRELGSSRQRLASDRERRTGLAEKTRALEAQRDECRRWDRLHSLIGSADGKKYRNFAQGVTFELMTVHANRQLVKMSDRYLLVRDGEKPLELNVIDNYQAGEVRSVKNLSGGEAFLVSLSLALGLSRMAGQKVRADSLFLDEGFGTLDEEALETALETLAHLQREGKLIGVISHVPALKERIPCQITVITGKAGRSRLSGPGVSRLN